MLTQAVNKQPFEAKQVHLHKAEKASMFCSESFSGCFERAAINKNDFIL